MAEVAFTHLANPLEVVMGSLPREFKAALGLPLFFFSIGHGLAFLVADATLAFGISIYVGMQGAIWFMYQYDREDPGPRTRLVRPGSFPIATGIVFACLAGALAWAQYANVWPETHEGWNDIDPTILMLGAILMEWYGWGRDKLFVFLRRFFRRKAHGT